MTFPPCDLSVACFWQIGVILRDSNGIAQVKAITGAKILRLLKTNGEIRDTKHYHVSFY